MKYIKPLFLTTVVGFVLGLALLTGIYFYIKPDLPSVTVLKDVRLQTPMQIYTKDGKLEGECNFTDGSGTYKGYYPDGLVKMEGTIKDWNVLWSITDVC